MTLNPKVSSQTIYYFKDVSQYLIDLIDYIIWLKFPENVGMYVFNTNKDMFFNAFYFKWTN